MICEHCGQDKEDVAPRVNPYILELRDKEVIQDLCIECVRELYMDV